MQYLGGKSRIAKHLATIINAERDGRKIWEPFCGGAWMTKALGGDVEASDINQALISLYKYVQVYGTTELDNDVTDEAYAAAKSLPDTDPRKAFIGFGVSFGGKWFGGLARPASEYARRAKNALSGLPTGARFSCASFFDREPEPGVIAYLDPPYRGTTGYRHKFDSDAFEYRVLEWARAGSVMYVSEYQFPHGRCVWERDISRPLAAGVNGSDKPSLTKTERLYRVAK